MKQGTVTILIFRFYSSILSLKPASDCIPLEELSTMSNTDSSKPLSILNIGRASPIFALHLRDLVINTYKATPNCRFTNTC